MGCSTCPLESELRGLALGYLPEGVLTRVAEHVDSCPQCEARVREFEHLGDPTLAALRRPLPPLGISVTGLEPPAVQGQRLAGYRILHELGRGGMGIVYEAEHLSLGRRVALKTLPGPYGACDPLLLERFRREGRAAARLHHTNIVPIYEVSQAHGIPFFTMQLIRGLGLDRIMEQLGRYHGRRTDPAGETVDSTEQAAVPGDPQLLALLVRGLLTGRFLAPEGLDHPADPNRMPPADAAKTLLLDPPAEVEPAAIIAGPSASMPRPTGGTPLPDIYFQQVARIGYQAAQALAYAHAQGVLHRDIKPSNLLLDTAGTLWVTDFGLAKISDAPLTEPSLLMGTLQYMAPERFQGECDARSDLYGLGLTLYELLVLEAAYPAGDKLQVMMHVKTRDPARPRSRDPQIPRDLETIVLKAIDKDLGRRYRSAGDLAEDLRRFLADEPIRARRASVWEQGSRWVRRHRGVAAALGFIAVLLVAVAIGATLLAARFHVLAGQKEAERDKARQAQGRAEEERATAQRSLYFAQTSLSGLVLDAPGGMSRVAQLLDQWRGLRVPDDPRGWEWYYCQALARQEWLTLRGHTVDVTTVAWSPDGQRLASGGFDQMIRIWEATTGKEVRAIPVGASVLAVCWNPTGDGLAAAAVDATVRIWDAATGKELANWKGHQHMALAVAWSPDGRRLASAEQGRIIVWDLNTSQQVFRRGHPAGPGNSVSWSPDSTRLATNALDQGVSVLDAATGAVLAHWAAKAGAVTSVRWSPDGNKLAGTVGSQGIQIWDAGTGREIRTLPTPPPEGFEGALAWSPDGRHLAVSCQDLAVHVWAWPAGQTWQFRGHRDRIDALSWSPDGNRLATADRGWNGEIKIWKVPAAPMPLILAAGTEESALREVSWSPDGRQLATTHEHGTITIWDAATGQRRAHLRGPKGQVEKVRWSPDGRSLASGGSEPEVRIWDLATQRSFPLPLEKGQSVTWLAWCPDGRRLAVGVPDNVLLWDVSTRSQLFHFPKSRGGEWSPDGRRLALGWKYQVNIRDSATGALLASWRNPEHGDNQSWWSADGQWIASLAHFALDIRAAATGQRPFPPLVHTQALTAVAWSPDNRRIATGTMDHAIHLWDAVHGYPILTLLGHRTPVVSLAWSPDGMRLASIGEDGAILIWDATRGYRIERAPSLLPVLNHQLGNDPGDREALRLRAGVYARLAEWDQAAADLERLGQLDPAGTPDFFQVGWWLADHGDDASPVPLEPFSTRTVPGPEDDRASVLRWYLAADDPNGYVPLAQGQPCYLTRVYARHAQEIKLRLAGAVLPEVWVNGSRIMYQGPTPIKLRHGWNTLTARVGDDPAAADVRLRPRIGFLLRLEVPVPPQ